MTRPGRAGFTWLILLVGLARASSARAPEAVWLELPECASPPYETGDLLRSLELELSAYQLRLRVQPPRAKGQGLGVRVGLPRCNAANDTLTLQYRDAEGQRSRERALSLRDVARPARARTLALVIAEALRPSRWREEAQPPESAPAPTSGERRTASRASAEPVHESTPSDLPVRQPPPSASARRGSIGDDVHDDRLIWTEDPYPSPELLRLGVGARARLGTREGNFLFGAELNLRGRLLQRSDWAFEAFYSGGKTWTEKGGNLDLIWYGAALGLDLRPADTTELRLGPRVALSRMEDRGTSTAALLTTLGGRLTFAGRLARHVKLDVQIELDHSLYVEALTGDRDSLPWYGWTITWGAGVSLDLI